MERRIQGFFERDASYEESTLVVFGAGMDATTSYRPGTRFAPAVMRQEFYGLETYSPYQEKDLCDYPFYDAGDLDFTFGNVEKNLKTIEQMCERILNDDKIPCMLGGEHLVTLGAMRAIYQKYPDVHVIHFDAHCDLRMEYIGEQLSHACVLRRVHEFLGDGRIHQFGIRSGERDEFLFAKQHCDLHAFHLQEVRNVMDKLHNVPIYITIDLDVLDPSIFPGTGTPEAGGVPFKELLDAILAFEGHNIVGVDLCELSPTYDPSGISCASANKVLREVLLITGGKENE